MDPKIRCKRIIDGRTYNTETATQLARWEDQEGPFEAALFKTRHGAYFEWVYRDDAPDEWLTPLTTEDARQWLEQHRPDLTDVIEAEFGEAPEAGDPEARITLRMPDTLHKRLAVIAKDRNQSLNAWVVRCLERCAAEAEASP